MAALALVGCSSEPRQRPLATEAKTFLLERCGRIGDGRLQLNCYTDHFERVRSTEGVSAALDELVQWHRDDRAAPFAPHCHEVLHQLGVSSMLEAATEDARIAVFADSRVTCTGGFVHGALTQYFETWDTETVVEARATLCPTLIESVSAAVGRDADTTGWLSWNCNHMLGHVLYDAYTDDLVAGAATCLIFDDDSDARRGCEAGFFMEHYLVVGRSPASSGYASTPTTMRDVHALCRDVDQRVARGCWNESGGVVYITANRDWRSAGDACRTEADTDEHLVACYESLARNIAPYAGYEPAQMQTWCTEIGDQLAVETCARVIAGSQAMELDDVPAGEAICRAMIQDQARRDTCLDGVRDTGEQLAGSGFGGGIGTWDRG